MALMFVSRFATNEPNRLCGTTESVQLLGPPLFRQVAQARHYRRRRQQSPSSGSRPVHSVTVPLALDHLRGTPKSGRVQSRYTLQKPLFDRLFCVLALFSSIDLVQKSGLKKKDGQTSDRIGPDPEADGSRFWTSETSVSPQVAPKTGPVTKSQILLPTRLKESFPPLSRAWIFLYIKIYIMIYPTRCHIVCRRST